MNLKKYSTKLLLITGCALGSLSAQALADESVIYSTEGYCILEKEGVSTGYLKAYAKKLGQTPKSKVCDSFNTFVANARPADWNYPGGKPYPGSVLRLSSSQLEKIRNSKKK